MRYRNPFNIKIGHFLVYVICLIISLILTFSKFFCDGTWGDILFSIGASLLASVLVGFFIDLANGRENKYLRERCMLDILTSYKICLEHIIKMSIRTILEFDGKNCDDVYKITLDNANKYIQKRFFSYDELMFTDKAHSYFIKREEIVNDIYPYFNRLKNEINELTNQSSVLLINYYTNDEIDMLKRICDNLEIERIDSFEKIWYLYDTLLDKNFCNFLCLKNINNSTFYLYRFSSGIYMDNILWQGRLKIDDIKKDIILLGEGKHR